MIKNPKLGQKVFFLDDKGDIYAGRISQVYNEWSIGIDNFFYLDKEFAFSTRSRALKYLQLKTDLEYAEHVESHWGKQKKKIQARLDTLLK
jgi:hypothetical protein